MQTQKIDLYKKLFTVDPNQKTLNWRQFIILNVLFFIFAGTIAITQYIQLYFLNFKASKAKTQLHALEKTFLAKKQQYPSVFFQDNADAVISNKTKELEVQKRLLTNISNHSSLANYLNELTHVAVPNSWMTRINIQNGGNVINLNGKAISYPAIYALLQNLNNSVQLQKYQLNIQSIKDNPNSSKEPIDFEVKLSKWPA